MRRSACDASNLLGGADREEGDMLKQLKRTIIGGLALFLAAWPLGASAQKPRPP